MYKYEFKQLVSKIDGLCYEDTCFLLYSLLSSLADIEGDILEIGAYKGRISISLALAVKKKNMRSKVFSLDVDYFNTKEEFVSNIKRFNLQGVIVPIFKPSSLANLGWKRPLKFIFIDTDGSYFSVKCDFILWERFLIKGGIIVLGCADCLDIRRFFKKNIEHSGRFEKFEDMGSILVAYKNKKRSAYFLQILYIMIIYTIYIFFKKYFLYYYLKNKNKLTKKTLNIFRNFLNKII